MARARTPLVFLPGALDGLEGSDAVAERLGAERPLIRIAYRPDDTFDRLMARILRAADEPFDLLGQSYGGWIAQCMARLQPERTRRIGCRTASPCGGGSWRFKLGRNKERIRCGWGAAACEAVRRRWARCAS